MPQNWHPQTQHTCNDCKQYTWAHKLTDERIYPPLWKCMACGTIFPMEEEER